MKLDKVFINGINIFMLVCGTVIIVNEYHQQHSYPMTLEIKSPPVIVQQVVEKPVVKKVHVKESFWSTLKNIESAGGKNRYRPQNKTQSCAGRTEACGVHQLTKVALQDIPMCKGKLNQCMRDRDNYQKSQVMANAYLKRLIEDYNCHFDIGWKDYLCWNMGSDGAKKIFKAAEGKSILPRSILKNMANNSPWSFKTLNSWGSKYAATKFLEYRRQVWNKKRIEL
jgi:hypothetical protein